MTSEDDPLPRWARHHEPAFQALLRALERVPGFILQPLETPSRDVDRVLAAWLTARGRPTHVLAPADPQAWRGLVAALRSLPREPRRIVLVSGTATVDSDVSHGLAMTNLHRDGIARDLACPLLWCGSPEFLRATWDRAPDFWSIANVVKRLPAQPLELPAPMIRTAATEDEDVDLEQLAQLYASARDRGDIDSAAPLGIRLLGALLADGQTDMAAAMAEQITALPDLRLEPSDALQLLQHLGRLGFPADELRSSYQHLLEQLRSSGYSGHRWPEAQALLQLGTVEHADGQHDAARLHLRESCEIFASLGDAQSEAAALLQLAQLVLDAGGDEDVTPLLERAEAALRQAPVAELRAALFILRSRLQLRDERFAEALTTLAQVETVVPDQSVMVADAEHLRGVILARLGDTEQARNHLERALELLEAQGDRAAMARVRRTLTAVAVDEADIETLSRCLAAAERDGDERAAIESSVGLALVMAARGDARQAAIRAWDAFTRSSGRSPALAPALHAPVLQLVHAGLGEYADDRLCAAIDRLLGRSGDDMADDADERAIIERAIARLRDTTDSEQR